MIPEHVADAHPPLTISFAPGRAHSFEVGLPILSGERVEAVFPALKPAGERFGFTIYRQQDWLLGHAVGTSPGTIEEQTFDTYLSLLKACDGANLCRIWNYVPGINALSSDGLEIYRAFSQGRSQAFEKWFGRGFEHKLPAASAVGTDSKRFAIVFAASRRQPKHFENPQQVPAYEYPSEHGPRPPSFARATVVPREDGRIDVFVSGTAAICGHQTHAPGETPGQVECTLNNLREISQVCGLGSELAVGRALGRHFKVYIRNADDLAQVSAAVEERLTTGSDRVSYLRADICRVALNLEIEATIIGAQTH